MKVLRSLLVLALAVVGFCLCNTSSYAQSKGKEAQQKIEKSKVGQDMRDVKKNAPATFDGSKVRRAPPPVKVQPTKTPTVTPTPRGQYVPKQYKSLRTTPPPSPKVTPKTTKTTPPSSSSSSSSSSTQKK